MTTHTLTPAYGRDYANEAEVLNDFNQGKDFTLATITSPWCGMKVSIRDMCSGDEITFRYKSNTKTMLHFIE